MAEAAPLLALSEDPAPSDGGAEWFVGAGGVRLRAALFPAQGQVRGSIVVSPGRTEPIEKYLEVGRRLVGEGFAVLIHDWRGQGLSHRMLADGDLGHAQGYKAFITDFTALLDHFGERLPRPWIALGHSMGGCLTLLALAEGESRFAGALLSAPMLGLNTGQVPRPIARALARVMTLLGASGAATPGSGAPAAFADNILTHDPVRYRRNLALVSASPGLGLGVPTWGWLDFAFAATRRLARGAGLKSITIPVVVLIAGDDVLVDNEASKTTAARAPKSVILEIAGARHELFQETDELQAPVWRAFSDLAQTCAAKSLF